VLNFFKVSKLVREKINICPSNIDKQVLQSKYYFHTPIVAQMTNNSFKGMIATFVTYILYILHVY
jgi:hypothetical protein